MDVLWRGGCAGAVCEGERDEGDERGLMYVKVLTGTCINSNHRPKYLLANRRKIDST